MKLVKHFEQSKGMDAVQEHTGVYLYLFTVHATTALINR